MNSDDFPSDMGIPLDVNLISKNEFREIGLIPDESPVQTRLSMGLWTLLSPGKALSLVLHLLYRQTSASGRGKHTIPPKNRINFCRSFGSYNLAFLFAEK